MHSETQQLRERAGHLKNAIATLALRINRPLKLMEVCGTHTVALFRQGIRQMLPGSITLLSGPGCPVCVTGIADIETAMALAARPGMILTTFGDMMRVPGGKRSLFDARADGADVRIVYSPLDTLKLAQEHPDRDVVFFATGFETTSPLVAATLKQAREADVKNLHIFCVHKLVPPALDALMSAGDIDIDGLILPGHACAITGTVPFDFVAARYGVASAVTGFEALEILQGILMILRQIAEEAPAVEIAYPKVVRREGNPLALRTIDEVFHPADAYWRGIGTIPLSGLALNDEFRRFDALEAFGPVDVPRFEEPRGCSCGEVLKGLKVPADCKLFGKVCTPERPVGACMVSAEGSCAAWYKYGGHQSA